MTEYDLEKNINPISSNTVSRNAIELALKKKSQVPLGIGLFIVTITIGIFLSDYAATLSVYWATGIAFGFTLQKSRFCFAASLRDPYLTGSTAMTKAVLIALAITTIGFFSIKYGAFINGQHIPGQEYIVPISLGTVIGGIIFGIGMVIAGGCASGVLMRTGEGFQIQIITLIFFILGTFWGAHDMNWWSKNFVFSKGIFLPDILGWAGALTVQLFVIAFLYVLADKWEELHEDS